MPRKSIYTKEEMIAKGLDYVREFGMENMTARTMGSFLGTTTAPLFVSFENMGDFKEHLLQKANELLTAEIDKGLAEDSPFLGIANHYVAFAAGEPKIYEWLFMSQEQGSETLHRRFLFIGEEMSHSKILPAIEQEFGVDEEDARSMARILMFYAHGLASVYAKKARKYDPEQVRNELGMLCLSVLAGRVDYPGLADGSMKIEDAFRDVAERRENR